MTYFSLDLNSLNEFEKNLFIIGIFLLMCAPSVLYVCCPHPQVEEDLHYKECNDGIRIP